MSKYSASHADLETQWVTITRLLGKAYATEVDPNIGSAAQGSCSVA